MIFIKNNFRRIALYDKKNRLLTVFFVLLFISSMSFFISCGDSNDNSNGQIDDIPINSWCYDESYHWKENAIGTIFEKAEHIALEPQTTVIKPATKEEVGEAKKIVKCSVCDNEISSETITLDKLPEDILPDWKHNETHHWKEGESKAKFYEAEHIAGAEEEIDRVEPTKTSTGSVTKVVKCTVCDYEISKETIILDKLPDDITLIENAQGQYEYMVLAESDTADSAMFIADYQGVAVASMGDRYPSEYGLHKDWSLGLGKWSYIFASNAGLDLSNGATVYFDSVISAWAEISYKVMLTRADGKTTEVLFDSTSGNYKVDKFSFALDVNEELAGITITFETPSQTTIGHSFGNVLIELK